MRPHAPSGGVTEEGKEPAPGGAMGSMDGGGAKEPAPGGTAEEEEDDDEADDIRSCVHDYDEEWT